jgi:hypothetical protein
MDFQRLKNYVYSIGTWWEVHGAFFSAIFSAIFSAARGAGHGADRGAAHGAVCGLAHSTVSGSLMIPIKSSLDVKIANFFMLPVAMKVYGMQVRKWRKNAVSCPLPAQVVTQILSQFVV